MLPERVRLQLRMSEALHRRLVEAADVRIVGVDLLVRKAIESALKGGHDG